MKLSQQASVGAVTKLISGDQTLHTDLPAACLVSAVTCQLAADRSLWLFSENVSRQDLTVRTEST